MYINNKILLAKTKENKEINLLPKYSNRHGLITGASGSGKTITLKVMAESFSAAGVPVFLVDVKGDLAGMCKMGVTNSNLDERIKKLNLENFNFEKFPTTFWDVYGKYGHPIRTTVMNIGPKLLARMLNLTETQEGVLTIVFKVAEDKGLELIDLQDLKAMLKFVGDNRKDYTLEYGNITLQSIGAIQRNLISLEDEGGDFFFGEPAFSIKDFIHFDTNNGYGFINILHATELFQKSNLYATFLLWLLTELYKTLPEIGDVNKPKIAFFFDEAHLLFSEMPDHIVKQIIQIVKLIRSKGIGLYFISQSPSDIPDEILAQLGNRVQHVLRAYTKSEEASIKAAANAFRKNESFNTEEAIKQLATGEALISFINENSEPSIVERAYILPPQSQIGTITDITRNDNIQNSYLYGKYENKINKESAYEKILKDLELNNKINESITKKDNTTDSITKKKTKQKKSSLEKTANKITNQAINTLGRKIGNSIFKGLFK